MGKNKKAHRKKVQARNQRIEQQRNKLQKLYTEMFEKLKNMGDNFSGGTESEEQTISGETENA